MKILCLFVRHGTTRHPDALEVLDRWYVRHGLLEQRTLWIVDNALDPAGKPAAVAPGVTLRPGDNRAWEFSSWERALREADGERIECDVVHFVTSAFNTLYTRYLEHFHPEMLDYVVARKTCLGHIDSNAAPVQPGGPTPNNWVRTGFFFLPAPVARTLSPWVACADPAVYFPSPDSREFRPDAPLSAAYKAHLTAWLEGRDIGGHEWHSPVGGGPEENRRFQLKTLAILNEHRLAATLRAAGIRLTDFCWLFSQRDTPLDSQTDPPPEAEQLKVRRRILGISEPNGRT